MNTQRTNEQIAQTLTQYLMGGSYYAEVTTEETKALILAALNEATAERDARILQLIRERDTYRYSAEQKIAIRREIEAELGVETGEAGDEALRKGLEAIRAIKAQLRERTQFICQCGGTKWP